MKKFFNSLKFFIKALALIVLLLVGWAFINVTNIVKGKKVAKDDASNKIFGPNVANADTPHWDPGCPQVAYFDGSNFRIENDFLCGSPVYYGIDYAMAPTIKRAPVRSDMVKFSETPQKKDGKLILQLQENEAEESFVDWIKLLRVVHAKNSKVVIDSSFDFFHVFDTQKTEKDVRLPLEALLNGVSTISNFQKPERLWRNPGAGEDSIIQKNDRLEFVFGELKKGVQPALIVKSTFRDWMMSEANVVEAKRTLSSYLPGYFLKKTPALLLVLAYFLLERKSAVGLMAFVPFVVGSGSMCKSIVFSYRDGAGNFQVANINKPRAWQYGTEYVSLPKESVQKDGSLHLRADFTKRHKLAFVGVLQNQEETAHRVEELPIVSVQSSRLGDVSKSLSEESSKYAHMIPGDIIDIAFDDGKIALKDGESETYIMQSSGFYTELRPRNRKLAGNWQEKISKEARDNMNSLIDIQKYV